MMELLKNLTIIFTALAAGGMTVRWLYIQVRNAQINAAFVEDVATNHLPHLYDAMQKLCEQQGIALAEPPPIRFIKFNGKN